MAKSRGFSIYLLKIGFSSENALKEGHNMELLEEGGINLPEGAIMYVADRPAGAPWWKNYWGISRDLYQSQKGALVFLPVNNRWLILTFGSTYHQLKDNSYEYDFGLRTTLNAIDPSKIKSTDILQPENAKRQRIQSPTASSLNFFDIRYDESIIKKLTGSVKSEYSDLFKNATGAGSLRITSNLLPDQIIELCRRLVDIYESSDYLQSFPDIKNIEPVRDPDKIALLNKKLVEAFIAAPRELVLSIPEIIDYSDAFKIKFVGAGKSNLVYNDVFIDNYRNYLEERRVTEITDVSLFERHHMLIVDENTNVLKQYNIYKCFLFEYELSEETYHLCEGDWYSIEKSFIAKIANTLDPYFTDNHNLLHQCNKTREDLYNDSVKEEYPGVYCLDKKNIAPDGQTQVEPCDLISVIDNKVQLIHVKISTRSSSLSHLFNQGVNSVELLRMEESSRLKLKELVGNDTEICNLVDNGNYSVTYGIITKKDAFKKSKNLPIFSRISLLRTVNVLKMMGIPCSIFYIYDNIDRKQS